MIDISYIKLTWILTFRIFKTLKFEWFALILIKTRIRKILDISISFSLRGTFTRTWNFPFLLNLIIGSKNIGL